MTTNRLQSRVRADRHQSIFIFGVHTLTPTLRSNGAFFLIPKKKKRQQQAKSTCRSYVSTSEKNEWTDSFAPVPYVILQKRVCVLSGSVPAEISKPGVDFQECNDD